MKGLTLKVMRIRHGLRQVELAGITGISQPVISRLERSKVIPQDLANKIREVFKAKN
jgi:predicted transcriptional regulator